MQAMKRYSFGYNDGLVSLIRHHKWNWPTKSSQIGMAPFSATLKGRQEIGVIVITRYNVCWPVDRAQPLEDRQQKAKYRPAHPAIEGGGQIMCGNQGGGWEDPIAGGVKLKGGRPWWRSCESEQ